MELILIRHTRVNVPKGLCYGQTEVPLADSFKKELEKILADLSGTEKFKVFSSPSKRCTALAHQISHNFIIDNRLKELNFGKWEGKNWNDIHDDYALKWMDNYFDNPCPEGESFQNLIDRFDEFLAELNKENVLIITHGGIIRAAYFLIHTILKEELFNLDIAFGSIHRFSLC